MFGLFSVKRAREQTRILSEQVDRAKRIQAEDPAAALELCQAVIASKPDHIAAHLGAASALEALGRAPQAIDHLDQVLEIDAMNSTALSGRERVAESIGDATLALSGWSRAIERFPDRLDYRIRREMLRLRLGGEREACAELARIAHATAGMSLAAAPAGYAARWMERPAEALDWFRKAAPLHPEQPHLRVEIARELLHLERFADLQSALVELPDDLGDVLGLRIQALARQNESAAAEALVSAMRAQPDATLSLVHLAMHLGFPQLALQGLQAHQAALPQNSVRTELGLARCWINLGEHGRAKDRIALNDNAFGVDDLLEVGELSLELGDDARAASLLARLEARRREGALSRGQLDRMLSLCDAAGDADRFAALAFPPHCSRTLLATIAALDGRATEAQRLVDEEAAGNPCFPAGRWRARVAFADGTHAGAAQALARRVDDSGPVALQDARLCIRAWIGAEEAGKGWQVLRRLEGQFAPRALVEERADLLRMDLRFEEELECLRRAVARDPLDETFACRLVDWLIAHGQTTEARDVLQRWTRRRPAAAVWLHKQLHLAHAENSEWDLVLSTWENVHARATPRARVDFTFERARLLRRSGRFEKADQALDSFIAAIPQLAMPLRDRNNLSQQAAHELTWLGRHAEARPIFDRQLGAQMTLRARDELHRLISVNESYGDADPTRYCEQRNCISNPRHHVRITPFAANAASTPGTQRVLVMAHLFHADLWPEIREYLAALGDSSLQLCVGIPADAVADALIADVLAFAPGAAIHRLHNCGFDVGGHWQMLDRVDLAQYDVVLLLQTKKSGHTRIGNVWRRNLMRALIGTPERWRENLRAMSENPRLGLIASALHQSSFHPWSYRQMRDVLSALGMPTEFDALKAVHEFVTGTMFLIRADLLGEMHARTRQKIVFEPYEHLSLLKRMDDSYAHAMERAFGMYVRWRGFDICWRP